LFNWLNQVSSYLSDYLIYVVCVVLRFYPHWNVLCAYRIFRELFELVDLTFFELVYKSFVLWPENSYIRYFKKFHSESLESKSSSPTSFKTPSTFLENKVMYNSAPQHLDPFIFIEYFKFKAGISERKVGFNPSHLYIGTKEILNNFLNVLFHVMHNILDGYLRLFPEDSYGLHLMKHRVVKSVNLISSVDIAWSIIKNLPNTTKSFTLLFSKSTWWALVCVLNSWLLFI